MAFDENPVFSSFQIGQRIRTQRKEFGFTQEHVSQFVHMSPRLIGEIERGRPTVGIQKVLDLAFSLGLEFTMSSNTQTDRMDDVLGHPRYIQSRKSDDFPQNDSR